MNIKEIREYIACPQFDDDHYGKWGALRLDQRVKIKHLLDYITYLEEENKKLKELNVCVGCKNNPDYKSRNDKAVAYIKEHSVFYEDSSWFEKAVPTELLDILDIGSEK